MPVVSLLLACAFSTALMPLIIRFANKHKLYDRYIIRTNAYTVPKARMLDERLVLDFRDAAIDRPQKIEINNSLRVGAIRIGQFSSDPPIARVVFDLKRDIHYETASMIGKGEVVVEISNNDQGKAEYAVKPETGEKPAAKNDDQKNTKPEIKAGAPKLKPPVEEKPKTAPKIKEAAKAEEKKPVLSVTHSRHPLKGTIIVIDPGHGGSDPGATGLGGVQEKEITLKTSFYLRDYLRTMGARIYMTRKSDIKNKLSEIADFTNRVRADAYIGVHYNAIDNPKISGTETHYFTAQSYKLAEAIHNRLLRGIRRQDRGIMKSMLYTIHHSQMPAIIVEPIYMTHFQDGLLIKSKSFQKEVARDISMGIEDYFNGR